MLFDKEIVRRQGFVVVIKFDESSLAFATFVLVGMNAVAVSLDNDTTVGGRTLP